jgi:hypothetical protein
MLRPKTATRLAASRHSARLMPKPNWSLLSALGPGCGHGKCVPDGRCGTHGETEFKSQQIAYGLTKRLLSGPSAGLPPTPRSSRLTTRRKWGHNRWYSQPELVSAETKVVYGKPDFDLISTSYVEQLNATTRLHMRRLTRLTLTFSKKRENFEAAVGLHFAYYNFVRRHNMLRCTPCMAAGVTSEFWTVGEQHECNCRLEGCNPYPAWSRICSCGQRSSKRDFQRRDYMGWNR